MPFGTMKARLMRLRASRGFKMRLLSKDALLITMPLRAHERDVEKFVFGNEKWIMEQRASCPESVSISSYLTRNPRMHLFSKDLSVTLRHSRTKPFSVVDIENGELVLCFPEGDEAALLSLIEKLAKDSICKRAHHLAAEHGFKFLRVSVRNQHGRWASCSTSGTLSFNWRVVLLSQKCQDYVILHELSHTRFMDHSSAFWLCLSRVFHNPKKTDADLGKIAAELFRIGAEK